MTRGIEIHNGHIIIPAGAINKIHMGTEALPITQQEIGQVVVSAVIEATILGGDVRAGEFIIVATENLTGNLRPLRVKGVVNANIVVTGYAYGIHIEQEVHAVGQVTGNMDGIRLEQYVPTGGITSHVHGIFISNFIQTAPTGNYYFIRAAENGGVTLEAIMYFALGGTSNANYFAILANTKLAWAATADKTGGANVGWIRVLVAGVERFIQLYAP